MDPPRRADLSRQEAVALARREQWHDVWMLQPRGELDLALEPLGRHAGGQLRGKQLDDDLAAEREFRSHIDARHPSAAELTIELVGIAERRRQLLAQIRVTPRG